MARQDRAGTGACPYVRATPCGCPEKKDNVMHDFDRNSISFSEWEKKKHRHGVHSHADHQSRGSASEHHHEHNGHSHGHDHPHGDPHSHHHHDHDMVTVAGNHDHDHPDTAYEDHFHDAHDHRHNGRFSRERVFNHLHEHKHVFYHSHHHTHDPEHRTLIHKVFKDPVRDWFAVGVMVLMIVAGYFRWLPGQLSGGILVCAAVIGIFPALKNAFFQSILERRPCPELGICVVLMAGLFSGFLIEVALCSLFLLMGSFSRLDFSWKGR